MTARSLDRCPAEILVDRRQLHRKHRINQTLRQQSAGAERVYMGMLLILALSFLQEAKGQLGETICSCAPSAYLLRLNVALPCSEGTLAIGDGIGDIDCVTNPEFSGNPNEINITSVTFLELDQNLQLLTSSTVTENLRNGDTVEFASFTVNPDEVTATRIPSTIEVGIMAQDQNRNSILTNWVVSFSNTCDVYPVISAGDSIGWSEFANVRPPPGRLCPLAATPTTTPTAAPPTAPSLGPMQTSQPTRIIRPSTKAPIPPGSGLLPTSSPGSVKKPSEIPARPPSTKAQLPHQQPCHHGSKSGKSSGNVFRHCSWSSKSNRSKGSKSSKGSHSIKGKGSKSSSKSKGQGNTWWSSSGSINHLIPTTPPSPIHPSGSIPVKRSTAMGSVAPPTDGSHARPSSKGYYGPLPASTPSATGSVPWIDPNLGEGSSGMDDGNRVVNDGTSQTEADLDSMPPVVLTDGEIGSSAPSTTITPAVPGDALPSTTSANSTGMTVEQPANAGIDNTSLIVGVLVGGGLLIAIMGLGIRHLQKIQGTESDAKQPISGSESTTGLTTQQGDEIYHLESHDVDSVVPGRDVEYDPLAPILTS